MIPKQIKFLAALAGLASVLAACGGGGSTSSGSSGSNPGPITIAVKNFSENSILGDMSKILLEKKGYKVTIKEISGNASIRDGLAAKQYDAYFEYLGTGLVDVNSYTTPIADPQKATAKLNELDAAKGIKWIDPTVNFNDPDVLVVKDTAIGTTMSAMATYVKAHPDTKFCVQAEFVTRTAGLKAIISTYGLPAADKLAVQPPEKESIALQDAASNPGRCQISQGFGTDPHIKSLGLTQLKDDKGALPNDGFALSILKSTLDAHSDIESILKPMTDKLTTQDSIDLQDQVDVQKKDELVVARKYLQDKGLL